MRPGSAPCRAMNWQVRRWPARIAAASLRMARRRRRAAGELPERRAARGGFRGVLPVRRARVRVLRHQEGRLEACVFRLRERRREGRLARCLHRAAGAGAGGALRPPRTSRHQHATVGTPRAVAVRPGRRLGDRQGDHRRGACGFGGRARGPAPAACRWWRSTARAWMPRSSGSRPGFSRCRTRRPARGHCTWRWPAAMIAPRSV